MEEKHNSVIVIIKTEDGTSCLENMKRRDVINKRCSTAQPPPPQPQAMIDKSGASGADSTVVREKGSVEQNKDITSSLRMRFNRSMFASTRMKNTDSSGIRATTSSNMPPQAMMDKSGAAGAHSNAVKEQVGVERNKDITSSIRMRLNRSLCTSTNTNNTDLPETRPAIISITPCSKSCMPLVEQANNFRTALCIALSRDRSIPQLQHATSLYIPYIAYLSSHEQATTSKNLHWRSCHSWYTGGVLLEFCFVICLSGIFDLKTFFSEIHRCPNYSIDEIKKNIRLLCASAGKWKYIKDILLPKVLSHEYGIDSNNKQMPIQLNYNYLNSMYLLCISSAQILHAWRAKCSNLSSSVIAKVSSYVFQQSKHALSQFPQGTSPVIIEWTKQINQIAGAWSYSYIANSLVNQQVNVSFKIVALREGIRLLEIVKRGDLLGCWVEDDEIEVLKKELYQAEQDNFIAYANSIPDVNEIVLPVGKSLVKPLIFDTKSLEDIAVSSS